jgi:hypothetical protein
MATPSKEDILRVTWQGLYWSTSSLLILIPCDMESSAAAAAAPPPPLAYIIYNQGLRTEEGQRE